MKKRLDREFFERDVLEVAARLPGKFLVRKYPDGRIEQFMITEVEAYRGEEDMACHASKGRTPRNQIMYERGGLLYIYLIYGIHWMLNIVTGKAGQPQAVLIRGLEGLNGPGRLTRRLDIDRAFLGEDLCRSESIWLTEGVNSFKIITAPRIGIDYAGEYWKNMPWRFFVEKTSG
ncbi:MAG TPA: DNA-3-methyladenine glycosylase [Bacteroidetes bacterium]|nr:DNA-3-methyladenine glycosylase [Bacteroidota bacterium]